MSRGFEPHCFGGLGGDQGYQDVLQWSFDQPNHARFPGPDAGSAFARNSCTLTAPCQPTSMHVKGAVANNVPITPAGLSASTTGYMAVGQSNKFTSDSNRLIPDSQCCSVPPYPTGAGSWDNITDFVLSPDSVQRGNASSRGPQDGGQSASHSSSLYSKTYLSTLSSGLLANRSDIMASDGMASYLCSESRKELAETERDNGDGVLAVRPSAVKVAVPPCIQNWQNGR